jgi:hypothetical protein
MSLWQVHLAHTAIKAEQEDGGKLTRAMSVSARLVFLSREQQHDG